MNTNPSTFCLCSTPSPTPGIQGRPWSQVHDHRSHGALLVCVHISVSSRWSGMDSSVSVTLPHLPCLQSQATFSASAAPIPVRSHSAPETDILTLALGYVWWLRDGATELLPQPHPTGSSPSQVTSVPKPPASSTGLGGQAGPGLAERPSAGWSQTFLRGSCRAPWEPSMDH